MLKIYHNTRICINLRWSPREQWTRGIFLKITLQPAQRGFIFPLHHDVICDQMKLDCLFYSVSQIRFFMIFCFNHCIFIFIHWSWLHYMYMPGQEESYVHLMKRNIHYIEILDRRLSCLLGRLEWAFLDVYMNRKQM